MRSMIKDTVKKLEVAVRALEAVDPKKKTELLGLIESLKSETDRLTTTHAAIEKLAESVRSFEGAHPTLVEIVDEICQKLSLIGI